MATGVTLLQIVAYIRLLQVQWKHLNLRILLQVLRLKANLRNQCHLLASNMRLHERQELAIDVV